MPKRQHSKHEPRRMDAMIGRYVRLRYNVVARSGAKYPRGTTLVVYGHWRGRLHLKTVRNVSAVRRVPRSKVTFLPTPLPRHLKQLIVDLATQPPFVDTHRG